jgi:hypothetical protein
MLHVGGVLHRTGNTTGLARVRGCRDSAGTEAPKLGEAMWVE